MKLAPHIASDRAPLSADEAAQLLAALEGVAARLRTALHRDDEPDEWLTTAQAMKLAHLGSLQVARNWARRYRLGRQRPGGQYEISKRLLLAVLADRRARCK